MLIRRKSFERNPYSMLERVGQMMEDLATVRGEGVDDLASWSPSVDIYDKDGKLVVEAELPGIKKDDIQVNVDNGVLTIRGERKKEEEVKEDDFYRVERSYGTFVRSFSLPSDVDADKIDASYQDGMLLLTIPRSEEAKPSKIKVH